MEEFEYQGKIINYNLERKKIKNCYISIKNSVVSLRVPLRFAQKDVNKLIEKKAEWILKTLQKQQKMEKFPKNI